MAMVTSRRSFLSLLSSPCWLPMLVSLPAPVALRRLARLQAPAEGTGEAERQLERYLKELTNQQRVSAGLRSLAWHEKLAEVARAHSADMLARGFFGHRNPDGADPGRRLEQRGLEFTAWAENLYELTNGPDDPKAVAASAFRGWMRSSGHRRNILDGRFRYLGIGVSSRDDSLAFTQLFAA
jgi:uncharacterized protein YkwD